MLSHLVSLTTLDTTQGQKDGFFSQPPFKCCFPEAASVGDLLQICPWFATRVDQVRQSHQKRESGKGGLGVSDAVAPGASRCDRATRCDNAIRMMRLSHPINRFRFGVEGSRVQSGLNLGDHLGRVAHAVHHPFKPLRTVRVAPAEAHTQAPSLRPPPRRRGARRAGGKRAEPAIADQLREWPQAGCASERRKRWGVPRRTPEVEAGLAVGVHALHARGGGGHALKRPNPLGLFLNRRLFSS